MFTIKDLQVKPESGQNQLLIICNLLEIQSNYYLFQGTVLDGHQPSLHLCHAKQDKLPKKDVKGSKKIIVKNVAFEATKKDLQQPFSAYGEVITKFISDQET